MEATGDYWKPFYYLLEDGPFEVMLVNAHDAKNLPGRKTDVSDAAWLAQLAAHGLLRGVRATRTDSPVAGPDPGPDSDHPGPDPGGATPGEGARGHRDQAVGGRRRHRRYVRQGRCRPLW